MKRGQRRTTFERERDLRDTAVLYLRGMLQWEIAQELNKRERPKGEIKEDTERPYTVTQQTVSKDIREIQTRWLGASLRDFDRARAEELAKIDNLEREYWSGWIRSCGERKTTTVKDRGSIATGPQHEAAVKREEMIGNPRFLEGVERCIERRCDILGLDAPKKIDLMDSRNPRVMRQKDLIHELTSMFSNGSLDLDRAN